MSTSELETHYLPLDTSRKQIRLLEIISITPKIICKFHTVSLLDNPSFCALSYVWGDESDTQDITVNDSYRSITSSLGNALEYAVFHWRAIFRDRDVSSCRLWADAICINQADSQEKGEQVQLMKEVYSMAEVVFCALDFKAPEKEMQCAFYALGSIATGADEDGFVSAPNEEPKIAKMRRVTEYLAFSCHLSHHLGVTVGSAIDAFCCLTYWKRAWIFQEVVLARRPVFIYRTLLMELSRLLHAHSWLSAAQGQITPEGTDQSVRDAIDEFDAAIFLSINWARTLVGAEKASEDANLRKQHQMSRRAIVSTGGTLEARDPKDHVYALLGIADLKLKPDYRPEKSLESVYIDLCAELIDLPSDFSFEFLFFLYHAGLAMQDELEQSYEFASWVPNLQRRMSSGSDANPPRPFERLWEIPSDISPWMDSGPSPDVFIRERSLFVRAVFVSTVLDLGPVISFNNDTWLSFVMFLFEMLNSPPYDTRHSHPLVTLTKALGGECQEEYVWEMPEILRIIRVIQYLLVNGQSTNDTDDSPSESKYMYAFGEEFLFNIGLGEPWRCRVLDEPPRRVFGDGLRDQLNPEEQYMLYRSSILEFLTRISDQTQFELEIAQAEKDAEKLYRGRSRLARAPDGGFMFVPWSAAKGDHVVLLKGVVEFLLIRKVDDSYLNVGRCSFSTLEKEIAHEVGLGERELVGIELR
ncbi:uncharacterized protein NECHADRAFT_81217 [Fusarium vanettenii 77-13-4]|uniref:Heterokaryon incompatibility domain-containing protein n=1 Tax=Fusarium vanettenii (strain ATCC MYA-4622 / CBS 123669 / FGSC 9596 / NRRL 45880 / 77-13-4) TaxID=660122 RepID=C7ZHQ1_FUSV7|nr:uncharacterized protein NECHADRAFT_81217 [Fusarium vanettenii 77-13-4]EEU36529.1 hypothetical protein NECHADRAFT_81217 [Fusarium vanettenii 77-13-4]